MPKPQATSGTQHRTKFSQVHGGGVIVDLSSTGLTAAAFGDNPLARVNGLIASWGKDEPISEVVFFGGD